MHDSGSAVEAHASYIIINSRLVRRIAQTDVRVLDLGY